MKAGVLPPRSFTWRTDSRLLIICNACTNAYRAISLAEIVLAYYGHAGQRLMEEYHIMQQCHITFLAISPVGLLNIMD